MRRSEAPNPNNLDEIGDRKIDLPPRCQSHPLANYRIKFTSHAKDRFSECHLPMVYHAMIELLSSWQVESNNPQYKQERYGEEQLYVSYWLSPSNILFTVKVEGGKCIVKTITNRNVIDPRDEAHLRSGHTQQVGNKKKPPIKKNRKAKEIRERKELLQESDIRTQQKKLKPSKRTPGNLLPHLRDYLED